MALSKELIEILVCPETKQPLHLAPREVVEQFNRQIEAGTVQTKSRKTLELAVSDLLVREDDRVVYQVRNDIPILLAEEAVDATLLQDTFRE